MATLTFLALGIPTVLTIVIFAKRDLFAPEVPDSLAYFPLAVAEFTFFGLANILSRIRQFFAAIIVLNLLIIGVCLKITLMSPSILTFSIVMNFSFIALVISSMVLHGKKSIVPTLMQLTTVWWAYLYSTKLPPDVAINFFLYHNVLALLHLAIYVRQRNESEYLAEIEKSAKTSQIGFMAAGISHEVNNPLTILSLNTVMLEKDLKEQGIPYPEKRIERIKAASSRVANIVRNVKDLAKDTFSHQIDLIQLLEIEKFLAEQKNYYLENKSGVEIDYHIENPSHVLECNKTEFLQVLTNLIKNGVEVLVENQTDSPKVKVHISTSHRKILIHVEDNGPGFKKEVLKNLGTAFNTSKRDGLGLGLSITQNIIHINNGKFKVANSPNGAHFHIELNRSAEAEDIFKNNKIIKTLNVPCGNILVSEKQVLHALFTGNQTINKENALEIIKQVASVIEEKNFHLIIQNNCQITKDALKVLCSTAFTSNILSSAIITDSFFSKLNNKWSNQLSNFNFPIKNFTNYTEAIYWTKGIQEKEELSKSDQEIEDKAS